MFTQKSVLLERINTAIKKNWNQKSPDLFDLPVNKEHKNSHQEWRERNYTTENNKTLLSVEKLEQRIKSLECQNDDLFYFINFLIEKLPDLVISILQTEWQEQQTAICPECETGPEANFCCSQKRNHPHPTPREKDVLELLVKGLCAKEIANRLFISETTVITHKKNLKEKFNAKNTVELISKATPLVTKK